jgi:hypothetical protein
MAMTESERREFEAAERNRLQTELDETRGRLSRARRTIGGTLTRLNARREDCTARATALLSAALQGDTDHRDALSRAAEDLTTAATAYQYAADLIALYEVMPNDEF